MRAIMLTSSSNQYLRPEYLTPLPTTLDAKKSPLALLAQTCSQIGADPPSSSAKSSLLNASVAAAAGSHHPETLTSSIPTTTGTGKSKGNHGTSNSSASSSTSSTKSHHGGHEHSSSSGSHEKNRKRTSVSPIIVEKVSSSNQSMNVNGMSTSLSGTRGVSTSASSGAEDKSSQSRSKTPGSKATTPNPGNASPNNSSASTNPANKSPTTPAPVTSSAADSTLSSSSATSSSSSTSSATKPPQVVHLPESSSSSKLRLNTNSPLNFGSANNSTLDLQLALKHGLPFPGLYPPVPSSASSTGTGIPPYLHSYARLKAAASAAASSSGSGTSNSASDSLIQSLAGGGQSCRDPFCTGCQLGQHGVNALKGACPAGCVQCDHHKTSSLFGSFPFLPGFPGLPPGFPGYYSSSTPSSSLQHPYVCNWIVGESYCGKRFTSSEELLQHLRSHTCFGVSSGASGSVESSAAAAVQNLAAAAAAAGYPPSLPPQAHLHHHPLLTSSHHGHSLLSRTYPTPPISPLSSNRFHPYSKSPGGGGSSGMHLSPLSFGGPLSLSIPPTGFPPGFSALGHPALSPYYPYSIYGQRLGASSGSLHP